ncbi:C40 family peptidase [Haloferula chungangensis]|uniref:C40 family peptidase n=1 Tax=Haloferula chungangensis TaxID=1048331 RepID=A0ABW2L610_9BACT
MRWLVFFISLLGLTSTQAHPLPGFPAFADLDLPEDTSPKRIAFIKLALESAAELKLNKYIFGSADPSRGGFDCSGSVFYLLEKSDIDPPRSSAAQFDWIKKAGNLTEVPVGTKSLDAPIFDKLQPGDLLFWSGTYNPADGRTNKITHVQIYLGREKKDGLQVMIGSTDGRSYRGSQRTGFGTYQFKLPSASSKSRFVGYGTPPGIK